jgi:hypothetical protein
VLGVRAAPADRYAPDRQTTNLGVTQFSCRERPAAYSVAERLPASLAEYQTAQGYTSLVLTGGKSHNEAMRCLKRRLSDLVYRRLIHDADTQKAGPGGHSGAALSSRAAG